MAAPTTISAVLAAQAATRGDAVAVIQSNTVDPHDGTVRTGHPRRASATASKRCPAHPAPPRRPAGAGRPRQATQPPLYTMTYDALHAAVKQAAAELIAHGVCPGACPGAGRTPCTFYPANRTSVTTYPPACRRPRLAGVAKRRRLYCGVPRVHGGTRHRRAAQPRLQLPRPVVLHGRRRRQGMHRLGRQQRGEPRRRAVHRPDAARDRRGAPAGRRPRRRAPALRAHDHGRDPPHRRPWPRAAERPRPLPPHQRHHRPAQGCAALRPARPRAPHPPRSIGTHVLDVGRHPWLSPAPG